jgi:hypothetical protein
MAFPIRAFSVLATATILSGCAGMSEQACLVSDWRTVGFEDGAGGRPVATIGSYRQACSKHGISPDLDSYRAGHAEGVEIYCRPGHAFEVGHSGAAYHGVCPADVEPDFLAGYTSGHHLYQLESALRRIDSQITSNLRAQESIKQELTEIAASMVSDESSAEERVTLVGRAAELGRRHSEISAETDALKQERLLHERDLLDYRETLASDF